MSSIAAERAQRIAGVGFDFSGQPTREVATCNLCSGSRFTVLTRRDRYSFSACASGCQTCSLVFLNPVMTADAYAGFYKHVYRPLVSAYHGRPIDAHTIQSEQRQDASERGEFLAPFVDGRGFTTLLDIGGSTGVVAHALATRFRLSGFTSLGRERREGA